MKRSAYELDQVAIANNGFAAPKRTRLDMTIDAGFMTKEQSDLPQKSRWLKGFEQDYGPADFCLCGVGDSANMACVQNGRCPSWDLELTYPDMDEFLGNMKEIKNTENTKPGQDLPKFLKTVPKKCKEEMAQEQQPPTRANTGAGRNCFRYSFTEEKALVHAKLRLQFEGFVGVENGLKLIDYYEYYLQKLAPNQYLKFHKRDPSALTRKFKAIKSNNPKLVAYIDRHVESRFWDNLVELVSHKPLLHPIFYNYKEKPLKEKLPE